MSDGLCIFTGLDAKITNLSWTDGCSFLLNIGVEYFITEEALYSYQKEFPNGEIGKLNCIAESIKAHREGKRLLWTMEPPKKEAFRENIKLLPVEEIAFMPLNHATKLNDLMRLILEKLGTSIDPFEMFRLSKADFLSLKIGSDMEAFSWVDRLVTEGLLDLSAEGRAYYKNSADTRFREMLVTSLGNHPYIHLTVDGLNYMSEHLGPKDTKNAFIAMAFTDHDGNELDGSLRHQIKEAIGSLGFNPIVIDEVEHNDGIMDKVVYEIGRSRFVVSELTLQKSGVYYESGYAKGLGLPVIHMVSKEDFRNIHFDVRHLNLIVWENHDDLSKRLKNRIRATVINP